MTPSSIPALAKLTVSPPITPPPTSTPPSGELTSATNFSFPLSGKQIGMASPFASPTIADDGSKQRIAKLEAQVRDLTKDASSTATKLTQYEQEIHQLRAVPFRDSSVPSTAPPIQLAVPSHSPPSIRSTSFSSSIASFLGRGPVSKPVKTSRTSSGSSSVDSTFSRTSTDDEHSAIIADLVLKTKRLEVKLEYERNLRGSVEVQLKDLSHEIEELSANLFEQANAMVANERKSNAILEKRVAELQRRDEKRTARLNMLERAMNRIVHVKNVLGSGLDGPPNHPVS